MELKILHLFPDVMSLYGDYANVSILRRHLEVMGVAVTVNAATGEDIPDFAGADFIYMGGGTERTQKYVLGELIHHTDALKGAIDAGALVLFTGNAMEVLGSCITDAEGKAWQALGLADFTTVETNRREPVDVVAETALWKGPAVGFMNKCSVTHGVSVPLFDRLSLGFGNEKAYGPEGYVDGSVFATHITGPVLAKNPEFVDLLIRRLFKAKCWELPGTFPVLPHEREAYEVTLRELAARTKH